MAKELDRVKRFQERKTKFYNPNRGLIEQVQKFAEINNKLNHLDYVMSPSYIQDETNKMNKIFTSLSGGNAPFKVGRDGKIKTAEDLEKVNIKKDEPNENRLFKIAYNKIVENKGLPRPNFWEESFKSYSMTGGFADMLGIDLYSQLGNLKSDEEGLKFNGKKLELNPEELELADKIFQRAYNLDEDKDFWDEVLLQIGGLTWDLPLMTLTNLAAAGTLQGALRLGKAGQRLARGLKTSRGNFHNYLYNVAQQGVNFNYLGVPQLIKSDSPFQEVLHNAGMGVLAATFPTIGMKGSQALQARITSDILRRNPMLFEEASSLASSLGFGTASGLAAGEDFTDALGTGLAFMGTHFTNPRSYMRGFKSMTNRPVAEAKRPYDMKPEDMPAIYVEVDAKNNKAYPIDAGAYLQKGEIKRLNVESYDWKKHSKNFQYIWEAESNKNVSLKEALMREDAKGHAQELLNRWSKGFNKDYFEKHKEQLSYAANVVARNMIAGRTIKLLRETKFPEDYKLRSDIIKEVNEKDIPPGRLEHYLRYSAADHLRDVSKGEKQQPLTEYDKAYTELLQTWTENINQESLKNAMNKHIFGGRKPLEFDKEPPFDVAKHVEKFKNRIDKAKTVDDLRKAYEDYYSPFSLYSRESMRRATQKEGTQKAPPTEKPGERPTTREEYISKNFRFTGDANRDLQQWYKLERNWRRITGEEAKEVETRGGEQARAQEQRLKDFREKIRQRKTTVEEEQPKKEGEQPTEVRADSRSRAIVNEVEKQFQKAKEMGERMDEKVITDKVEQVRDPRELDRLEKIYTEALEYNRRMRRGEKEEPEPKETPEQKRDREINEKVEEIIGKRADEILAEKRMEEKAIAKRIKEIEELQKRMRERGEKVDKENIEMLERFKRDYKEKKEEDKAIDEGLREEVRQIEATHREEWSKRESITKNKADQRIKYIDDLIKRLKAREVENNKENIELLENLRKDYEGIRTQRESETKKTISIREAELLEEVARDISNTKEETVKKRIERIDEFLKEKIPDELARATATASISGREKLPKQTQQLLRTRDALVRRRHDIRAERGGLSKGEEEVATPEARQNLLKLSKEEVIRRLKATEQEDVGKLRDKTRDAIEKTTGVRGKDKFQKVGKALGLSKYLNPVLKAADKMGFDIKYVRPSEYRGIAFAGYGADTGTVEVYGNAFGQRPLPKAKRRASLITARELLEESVVHEIIHGMTLSAGKTATEAFRFYSQELVPIAENVRKVLKEYYDADRSAIQQATGRDISYEGSLRRGLDYMLTRQARGRSGGVEEMFTVAFTIPEVARYMDMIPANKPLKNQGYNTLWDAIVGGIRKLYKKALGLPEGSLLDQFTQELSEAYVRTGRMKSDKPEVTEKMKFEPAGLSRPENAPPRKTDLSIDARKHPYNQFMTDSGGKLRPETKNALERKYGISLAPENLMKTSRMWSSERAEPEYYKNRKPAMSKEEQRFLDDIEATKSKLNQQEVQLVDDKLVTKGEDAFKKIMRESAMLRLRSYTDKYLELNMPPIFKAETTERFNSDVYRWGEDMIRTVPYQVNSILQNREGWNSGAPFRKMAGISSIKGFSQRQKVTQEAQEFLEKIRTYDEARYQGAIERDLTWSEWKDWAKLTDNQRKVADAMEKLVNDSANVMKERFKMYIADLHENVADFMSPRQLHRNFSELFEGKKLKDITKKEMREIKEKINTTPEYREKVADRIVENKYGNWGKTFYYNAVRPSDPKVYILEARKRDKNDKVVDEFNTYFANKESLNQAVEKAKANGYDIEVAHQIKDMIKNESLRKRLSPQQILELAFDGQLDMSNKEIAQTVDKLISATKSGVDLHTVNKKYMPGMKYTAEEFEIQMERFVREAIYSSHKTYFFKGMQQNLDKWIGDVNTRLQKMETLKYNEKRDLAREKNDLEYAQKYVNQLKQPERTVIDNLRGATFSFQIGGIKPMFLFQQAHQTFQTGVAQSIADAKKLGLTTGDALRHFRAGLTEALKVNFELQRRKKGIPEEIRNIKVDKELVDAFDKLEKMQKIGSAGITELTAQTAETDFTYSTGLSKVLQAGHRGMTWAGRGVEKMTRSQIASTYYRIGKQAGLKGDKLINFMADGIDRTMAEWGKGGRAPIFDPKGKPSSSELVNAMKKSFMTYKTFSFYNYGMWRNLIRNKEWSGLTAKVLVGLGAHGITKFPLFATMMMLADWFSDEDIDYTMLQGVEEVDKAFGKVKLPWGLSVGMGEFLHKGVYAGLGMDLRETFGEDTPLVSDLYAEAWSRTWEAKLLEIALGAPFGFSEDMMQGVTQFNADVVNQILDNSISTKEERDRAGRIYQNMMPMFLRNVIKGMNMKEDGIEMRGKTILFPDELSASDIALKMMSFNPSRVSDAYTEAESGVESKHNQAKEKLRRAKNYRAELSKVGVSGGQLNNELQKVAEHMQEARKTIRKLEPKVKQIKRQREFHERIEGVR